MPKRISETSISTSMPSDLSRTKRRKTGHTGPLDGPSAIPVETRPWFEIPEVVEKILSYLENPRDIARAELVNKTFQNRSWRVTKELHFYIGDRRIHGPFLAFRGLGSKWLPSSDMTDVIPVIWKKCRNLRTVVCTCHAGKKGSPTKGDFLVGILKAQRLMNRKIEILDFSYATVLSPVFPHIIELCSDSLTTLCLTWSWVDGPDSPVVHLAVTLIAHAVRLCRNLQYFCSVGSPDGIGKLFLELSDKTKLKTLDVMLQKSSPQHDNYGLLDLTTEMSDLAECLSALQSAKRSFTKGFRLRLVSIRELGALIDAGNSRDIEWNMITALGEICREVSFEFDRVN